MKPKLSTWGKTFLGVPIRNTPTLFPGIFTAALLTWLSLWLADLVGERMLGFDKSPISPVMIAIVLGLTISAIYTIPQSLKPGLSFSIKKILRLGIILLGIRLTIFDVFKLGVFGVPIVGLCILGALLITTQVNKKLKLAERLGVLIAVGTSICGVTAIVATSPAIDAEEEESAYAVTVITIFGLFATLIYPYLANTIFSGNALKAGLFLGTSVHETAQVVGAAKIFADIFSATLALDVATVTKLVRNVFMAFVIPYMAYFYARKALKENIEFHGKSTNITQLFPMFILGFILMATLRSIGDAQINSGAQAFGLWASSTWQALINNTKALAELFLVMALAGVGLNTNFKAFRALGIKPFLVGLGASLAVGIVSYIAITMFGSLVIY